jgi:hypothetical protein
MTRTPPSTPATQFVLPHAQTVKKPDAPLHIDQRAAAVGLVRERVSLYPPPGHSHAPLSVSSSIQRALKNAGEPFAPNQLVTPFVIDLVGVAEGVAAIRVQA